MMAKNSMKYFLVFLLGIIVTIALLYTGGSVIANYFSVDENGNTQVGRALGFANSSFTCNSTYNLSVYYKNADLIFCKDTVEISLTAGGGSGNTTEEMQDITGGMVNGGTETRIAVTYDDGTGKLNFVVDNMNDDNPEPEDVDWTDLTDAGNNGFWNSSNNETDPVWLSNRAEVIENASDGKTAFGWGDHSLASYESEDHCIEHDGAYLSCNGEELDVDANGICTYCTSDAVNTTTNFGGEVSGTYDAIVLDHDALDDQYYDSEADLTGLLDDDYVDVDGDTMTGDLTGTAYKTGNITIGTCTINTTYELKFKLC